MPDWSRPRMPRAESLWTGGTFVALAVALVAVTESRFPHWTDREYAARREILRDRVAEGSDRPVLAVLGSSRVGTGFAPEVLPEILDSNRRPVCVFNYSHMGSGPRLNYLQLCRLLRDGVRPGWVLLELLPGHLHREDTFFNDLSLADVEHLTPYWEDDRWPLRWLKYRVDAPTRFRQPLLGTFARSFRTGKPVTLGPLGGDDGWERPEHLSDDERYRLVGTIREQYRDRLGGFHIDPVQDRVLRATLDLCRDHGIEVALIVFPENQEYRSWYAPGVEGRIQDYLGRLRVDFAIPTIDTRDWMPEAAFNDPHHLTAAGARDYTLRLGREVLGPFVAGTGSALIVPGEMGK